MEQTGVDDEADNDEYHDDENNDDDNDDDDSDNDDNEDEHNDNDDNNDEDSNDNSDVKVSVQYLRPPWTSEFPLYHQCRTPREIQVLTSYPQTTSSSSIFV